MKDRKYKKFIKQRVQEALAQRTPHRSLDLLVGGGLQTLPVISVPTDHVLYNHNNHRLTAQLEDTAKFKKTTKDYLDPSFQKILHGLLSSTDEFQSLKEQIESLGQREPGVITPDGLLINGNTRCAALKELEREGKRGFTNIDVAVLNESVTETDISGIEMNLQMVKLIHQDYTFTNQLLFMKNFMKKWGKTEEALAKEMDWKRGGKKKVQQHMRILSMIEEVRALGKSPIPYSDFDTKKEVLVNLDVEVENLTNNGDIEQADQIKYARFLGLFMGLNKDQIREIDGGFIQSFTSGLTEGPSKLKKLLGKHTPKEEGNTEKCSDFDDDVVSSAAKEPLLDTKSLLSELVQDGLADADAETEDAFSDLAENLQASTDKAVIEKRAETKKIKIDVRLREIKKEISGFTASLPDYISHHKFNPIEFESELGSVGNALKNLEENYNKYKSRNR